MLPVLSRARLSGSEWRLRRVFLLTFSCSAILLLHNTCCGTWVVALLQCNEMLQGKEVRRFWPYRYRFSSNRIELGFSDDIHSAVCVWYRHSLLLLGCSLVE